MTWTVSASPRLARVGYTVIRPEDLEWETRPSEPGEAQRHVAGLTETMFRRSGELFAQNLQQWAAGQTPAWAANAPSKPIRRPD